jgi:hypothetical protein
MNTREVMASKKRKKPSPDIVRFRLKKTKLLENQLRL